MLSVILTYYLVYLFGIMFYSLGYILLTCVLLVLPHFNEGSREPRDHAILIHYHFPCVCKGSGSINIAWINEWRRKKELKRFKWLILSPVIVFKYLDSTVLSPGSLIFSQYNLTISAFTLFTRLNQQGWTRCTVPNKEHGNWWLEVHLLWCGKE